MCWKSSVTVLAIASACTSPSTASGPRAIDRNHDGKIDGWDEIPEEPASDQEEEPPTSTCVVCLRSTLDPASEIPSASTSCGSVDVCVSDDVYAGTSEEDWIEAAPLAIETTECACAEDSWLDLASSYGDLTAEWVDIEYDVDEDDDYVALNDEDLYAFGQLIGAL